jgi:hypothetical protein
MDPEAGGQNTYGSGSERLPETFLTDVPVCLFSNSQEIFLSFHTCGKGSVPDRPGAAESLQPGTGPARVPAVRQPTAAEHRRHPPAGVCQVLRRAARHPRGYHAQRVQDSALQQGRAPKDTDQAGDGVQGE